MLVLTALSPVLAPLPLYAEGEIYVVDVQRVINDSVLGKAARAKIQAEATSREARLEKIKNEVQAQRAELEKQARLLAADALEQRQESLQRKERELARAVQDEREELGKRNDIILERVVRTVDEVTADLAKQNGYDVVLERDRQLVLYVSKQFDITDRVIAGVDKKKVALPE
jgi:outer membrane protein